MDIFYYANNKTVGVAILNQKEQTFEQRLFPKTRKVIYNDEDNNPSKEQTNLTTCLSNKSSSKPKKVLWGEGDKSTIINGDSNTLYNYLSKSKKKISRYLEYLN